MTRATGTGAGLGLSAEQTELVLTTAARAPSPAGSRPWALRVRPDLVELHADPGRRPPAVDPADRELRLACGAALYTLRLALVDLGVRPLVTALPDRRHPTLLAEVRCGGATRPTPEQRRLLAAVPHRRTGPHPSSLLSGAGAPVSAVERYALRRAAAEEGAWLHLVTDPGRVRAVQDLAGGAAQPQDDGADPLIAVLTSHPDGPDADVRAGGALQRVLLTATADGLAASVLSHVVEAERARAELRRLLGAPFPPQAVLRIGRSPEGG
jgi:hypothetical protein